MSKLEKLKKAGLDIDDVSSVSSNASEEPPPPGWFLKRHLKFI